MVKNQSSILNFAKDSFLFRNNNTYRKFETKRTEDDVPTCLIPQKAAVVGVIIIYNNIDVNMIKFFN